MFGSLKRLVLTSLKTATFFFSFSVSSRPKGFLINSAKIGKQINKKKTTHCGNISVPLLMEKLKLKVVHTHGNGNGVKYKENFTRHIRSQEMFQHITSK